MNDLRNTIWNKRLPSLLGFFFLVFAFGTITWLSRNAILFGAKAAVDETPKNILISNIADTSFTVSYTTDDTVLGTINFGKGTQTNQIVFDDRDKTNGIAQPHRIHYMTIQSLEPTTKYSFTITSGTKIFSNNNAPYEVTTGIKLENAVVSGTTLTGKVTLDSGSFPSEAIVSLSSSTSQLTSILVGADGTYTIDLSLLRNKDLASLAELTPETVLQMQIMDSALQSHISLLTSQSNPVPLVILSKDYDFAVSDEPLAPSIVASGSAEPVVFPSVEDAGGTAPEILTPQDDQGFKDQQPVFKGKALPNGDVEITIQSEQEINTTVSADGNGNWKYRPTTPLAPGNHTITIRTLDANGIIKTLTQSFVVYAQGSEFTQPSVSPSLTTTLSPTTKPTATAAPSPTRGPTNSPTPTQASTTLSPTLTTTSPSPTQSATISISTTNPPVPVTGNNASLPLIILSIISVVGIGALLFFFTMV